MKTTEREALIQVLKIRFEKHMHRHAGTVWSDVHARLEDHPEALKALAARIRGARATARRFMTPLRPWAAP